jgi:uncharacterized protein (DUF736 family)
MQTVGYLKHASKDNGESYSGQINTLSARLVISLMKPNKKASERSPDFDVYGEGMQNNLVKIGAAWKKKGRERQFFTLEIDDPSLPDALSLLAFRQDDGSYNIVWKRAN